MKLHFSTISGKLKNKQCHCLFLGIYEGLKPDENAQSLIDEHKHLSTFIRKTPAFTGAAGDYAVLNSPEGIQAQRVIFVGLGKKRTTTPSSFAKIQACIAKTIKDYQCKVAVIATLPGSASYDILWSVRQSSRALQSHAYRFANPLKESNTTTEEISTHIIFWFPQKNKKRDQILSVHLNTGQAIGYGINVMKQLADTPANLCTPTDLAHTAQALAQQHKTLTTIVHDFKALKSMNMEALLSVAQGSSQPPVLIEMHYKPKERITSKERPIVLVGKGVTFDTGGISIKPSAHMDEMKFDMSGAASVIGTMKAIAAANLKRPVIALIPATENMPAHNATKPGDVVKSASGKSIEVLNTDAEGRLILCDALHYGQAQFNPEAIIDVATLTGACVIALGEYYAGLMSNNQKLVSQLLQASSISQDRCWQLPLDADYDEHLHSNFADMANISDARGAGTITAGCFLQRFIQPKIAWAHLDIAGVAWKTGRKKGSTGRPVALLCEYLFDNTLPLLEEQEGDEAATTPSRGLIGSIITDGLRAGKSTRDILNQIHTQMPNAKTQANTIAFYAYRMRKNGEKIPKRPR